MRRICPKCGSEIPQGELNCPTCKELEELDKSNGRKLSSAIYHGVVVVSCVFAALLIASGITDFSFELREKKNLFYLPQNALSFILIPLAFALFTVLIILFERSKYLMILPITGMAAEGVQLITEAHDNIRKFYPKDGYFYGTVAMDIFSAALVVLFFVFMIRLIRRGYTINQSRWLIVAAFVPVFARIVLMICLFEDYEPKGSFISYADQSRMYMLFAAALINVKKRYINSKASEQ